MQPGSPVIDHVMYRICQRAVWARARRIGEVMRSPEEARDGCMHLLRAQQLEGTLARQFAGQTDLVLLVVRLSRLPKGSLRWPTSSDGDIVCLRGPLTFASVEEVYELPLDLEGTHALPPCLVRDERAQRQFCASAR
jgi:uncharacterized protein (DUF952 family)